MTLRDIVEDDTTPTEKDDIMAQTPKSVTVEIDWDRAELKEALANAEAIGFTKGVQAGHKDILDFLEHAYINDSGRPDRGTPKAEAILEVAKAASKHIQKLEKRKIR